MSIPIAARCRARDGTEHRVVVRRTANRQWRGLDLTDAGELAVETLTGDDDRLGQAQALARDYAAEQQAFQLGLREDPLPALRAPTGELGCAA